MKLVRAFGSALLTVGISASSYAFEIANTPYGAASVAAGIDPYLLYSVSLIESAYAGSTPTSVRPHKWALRYRGRSEYFNEEDVAARRLESILSVDPKAPVDIGLMQINWAWHHDRVAKATDLLDPLVNVQVASAILNEAMKSAPGDLELGVGRYHIWSDETLARNYGSRVLAVYRNVLQLGGR